MMDGKYSKYLSCLIIVLFVGILLLSSYEAKVKVKAKGNKVTSTVESYQIGEKILADGRNSYYYGGMVSESIVINAVINEYGYNSVTIPIYIDVAKTPKSANIKLPESSKTIQIKGNDSKTGGVKIKK